MDDGEGARARIKHRAGWQMGRVRRRPCELNEFFFPSFPRSVRATLFFSSHHI